MKRILLAALTVLTISPFAAFAQGDDGDAPSLEVFVRQCEANIRESDSAKEMLNKAISFGECKGYLKALVDLNSILVVTAPESALVCTPTKGVSLDQAIKILKKYADSRPEILHEPARVHIVLALRLAFPCKNSLAAPASRF